MIYHSRKKRSYLKGKRQLHVIRKAILFLKKVFFITKISVWGKTVIKQRIQNLIWKDIIVPMMKMRMKRWTPCHVSTEEMKPPMEPPLWFQITLPNLHSVKVWTTNMTILFLLIIRQNNRRKKHWIRLTRRRSRHGYTLLIFAST